MDDPFGIEFFNRIAQMHVNEARRIDPSWRSTLRNVQSDAIRAPVEAYWQNLDRLDSMAFLPFVLTSNAIWGDRLAELANGDAFLQLLKTGDTNLDLTDTLLRSMAARQGDVPFPPAEKVDRLIELLLGLRWHYVSDGFHALLGSQLILAWMSFESLAADLWVNAVNARPYTLAANVLSVSTQVSVPKGAPSTQGRKDEISLNVDALKLAKFNLASCMGNLLKERKRVSFLTLDGIEKGYRAAFRTPNGNISQNLDELLNAAHPQLAVLEKMRHLLAHKGGVIDEKFRNAVKPHSPTLAAAPDGRLPLDGRMVRDYTTAALLAGQNLINFVDNWLSTMQDHPID